jgi:hypothetical protein
MVTKIKIRQDLEQDTLIPSAVEMGMWYARDLVDGAVVMWQDEEEGTVLAILTNYSYACLSSIDLDFESYEIVKVSA